MLSAEGSAFVKDMGFWGGEGKGGPFPGVTTFKMKGKKIQRVSRAGFGPGDDFCPVWSFFDLLDGGAGDWTAKFHYGGKK